MAKDFVYPKITVKKPKEIELNWDTILGRQVVPDGYKTVKDLMELSGLPRRTIQDKLMEGIEKGYLDRVKAGGTYYYGISKGYK